MIIIIGRAQGEQERQGSVEGASGLAPDKARFAEKAGARSGHSGGGWGDRPPGKVERTACLGIAGTPMTNVEVP